MNNQGTIFSSTLTAASHPEDLALHAGKYSLPFRKTQLSSINGMVSTEFRDERNAKFFFNSSQPLIMHNRNYYGQKCLSRIVQTPSDQLNARKRQGCDKFFSVLGRRRLQSCIFAHLEERKYVKVEKLAIARAKPLRHFDSGNLLSTK